MKTPSLNDSKYRNIDGSINLELYDNDENLYWESLGEPVLKNDNEVKIKNNNDKILKDIAKVHADSMLPPPIKNIKLKALYAKLKD